MMAKNLSTQIRLRLCFSEIFTHMKLHCLAILITAHFSLLNAYPTDKLTDNCISSGIAQDYLIAVSLQNSWHEIQHFKCHWCCFFFFFQTVVFTIKEGKAGHDLYFSHDWIWVSQARIHNPHTYKCQDPINFSQHTAPPASQARLQCLTIYSATKAVMSLTTWNKDWLEADLRWG